MIPIQSPAQVAQPISWTLGSFSVHSTNPLWWVLQLASCMSWIPCLPGYLRAAPLGFLSAWPLPALGDRRWIMLTSSSQSPRQSGCVLGHFSHVWLFATLWTVAHQTPVPGILQARILEWVAIPFSRGSSQPRDWTQVSCTVGRFFTVWATKEAPPRQSGWIQFCSWLLPSLPSGNSPFWNLIQREPEGAGFSGLVGTPLASHFCLSDPDFHVV